MIVSTIVLWVELIVRSGAIVAGTLFMPLALAGIVWPVTALWAKRLAETLFALIISKLVIVVLLVTGTALMVGSNGVAGTITGVTVVLVASFAPFALLRLLPFVEAAAVGHLDGLARRGMSRSVALGLAAMDGVGGMVLGSAAMGGAAEGPQPPMAEGEPPDEDYLRLFGPEGFSGSDRPTVAGSAPGPIGYPDDGTRGDTSRAEDQGGTAGTGSGSDGSELGWWAEEP